MVIQVQVKVLTNSKEDTKYSDTYDVEIMHTQPAGHHNDLHGFEDLSSNKTGKNFINYRLKSLQNYYFSYPVIIKDVTFCVLYLYKTIHNTTV